MATKKTNNATKSKIPVSAKIDRMIDRENATVKAYASVNIGGAFVIKDIAVVDGHKGMSALPSEGILSKTSKRLRHI